MDIEDLFEKLLAIMIIILILAFIALIAGGAAAAWRYAISGH
jgi:hypothetical protein